MIQKTDDSKSTLFSALSHEIRSALNSITASNNLLLETDLTSEQRGYVESIRESNETLLSLVNDLIDFTLIEAAELKADDIEFDLRTAVEEAMETVAYQGLELGSEVHTLIHSSAPQRVRGDPARIRQIIVNLAGNALEISGSGEVVLSVRTVEESSQRAVVRFDVTGLGSDLSPDQLRSLFEPFSSPESVSSWKYGRRGLGLALSKRLVQLMGGQIGFSTVEGSESTFWFSIDLKKCQAAVPAAAQAVPSLEGMNILIADPSPSGRRIMVHYLESMGCRCRDFEHAEDILMDLAYSTSSDVKYDAVIMALHQVGEDDYGLVSRFKADPFVSCIPLVLVTAIGKRGDALKMQQIGVAAYLTRPLKRNELIDCLGMIRRESAELASCGPTAIIPQRRLITRHTIAEETAGRKFRILVADDNAVCRRSIKKYLDNAGYTCDVAENGFDAVESFGRREYDFVFLDCHMPIMNGYEAVGRIRKKESESGSTGHVPVCGMITVDSSYERAKCLEAGMDDCIVKPVKRAQIIAILDERLRKELSSAENRSVGS